MSKDITGRFRTAYQKLENDLTGESKELLLQIAVNCVNNTVGPEGFCPTMCVFGAIPRPARKVPAPTQVARAKAIDEGMKVLEKDQAKRRVQFALKYKGPYGNERKDLDSLHFGTPVRVFRENSERWEGHFKFIFKEGETVCVQLPHGRKIFRSHVVKPVKKDSVPCTTSNIGNFNPENLPTSLMVMFGDEGMLATPNGKHSFKDSRRAELSGLKKARVFKVLDRSDVPLGTRIYGTRWVDSLKKKEDGSFKEKSRLVAQNYRDYHARKIPTKAPTISKLGQRIALCIAAMNPEGQAYLRDVTQAYTQSKSELERDVFLEPPPEMNLPSGKVLLAVKPLYGVPESGLHWF